MTVVLIGNAEWKELDFIAESVRDRGEEAVILDTQDWPGEQTAEFSIEDEICTFGDEIALDEVTGVFALLQTVFHPIVEQQEVRYRDGDNYPKAITQPREWRSLFRSMMLVFESYGADIVPAPKDFIWHDIYPWMIDKYHRAGIPVPPTIFTNEPDRVRSFVAEHQKVVYLTLNGGVKPQILTEETLEEAPLERLKTAPVRFQAYAPGDDVRAYVVDGELVGAFKYAFDGDAFTHKNVPVSSLDAEVLDPTEELEETVLKTANLTPGSYCAVDIRLEDPDTFSILEANVPGRFAGPESVDAVDVSGALAEYLI